MFKGTIYFYDGHTEIIQKYEKAPNGIIKLHTSDGDYFYKETPYSVLDFLEQIMPSQRYIDVTEYTQPIYYERMQELLPDGNVVDRAVKVGIEHIEYIQEKEVKESAVPNLKAVMAARQMTIEELSKRTGYSVKTLKGYIDGTIRPRENTIRKIASSFFLKYEDLIYTDRREIAMLGLRDPEEIERDRRNARIALDNLVEYIKDMNIEEEDDYYLDEDSDI